MPGIWSPSSGVNNSTEHVTLGNLIREIPCSQSHIPGFSYDELESLVFSTLTMSVPFLIYCNLVHLCWCVSSTTIIMVVLQ